MIDRFSSYSLLPHNTFGMDVKAAQFIEFTTVEDVISIAKELGDRKHLVIGGGSNLLFMGE